MAELGQALHCAVKNDDMGIFADQIVAASLPRMLLVYIVPKMPQIRGCGWILKAKQRKMLERTEDL